MIRDSRRRRAASILGKTRLLDNGCIEWTGARLKSGYGQYRTADGNLLAHRLVYELMVGPIPVDRECHHSCDNPACVNPLHIKLMTRSDHWRQGNSPSARRARQTHCQHGHAFDAANTYVTRSGHRRCRTCHRDAERAARRWVKEVRA